MVMNQHLGYRRLSIAIPMLVFAASLVIFWLSSSNEPPVVLFVAEPISAAIVALGFYAFIRLVYWIIDGFILVKNKQSEGV